MKSRSHVEKVEDRLFEFNPRVSPILICGPSNLENKSPFANDSSPFGV